jgi:hypothetical protein
MTDKRQVDHVLNRDRSQQLQRKGQTRAARSKLWAKNIFFNFSPKIACQAPKQPNSFKQNKIELAY